MEQYLHAPLRLHVVIRYNFTSLPTCYTSTCGIVVKQTLETQINESRQRKVQFCDETEGAWFGLVWSGLAWPGLIWPGLAWPDTEARCVYQPPYELQ